ncbi:hypothetical protein LINGRAPRIM_LOCUS2626 [Linum grandiflorum]
MWSNRSHTPAAVIQCRLDRFLLSADVFSKFPSALVSHLSDIGSDHRAIALRLEPPSQHRVKSIFQFDSRWLANPEVDAIVRAQWAIPVIGSKMYILNSKLKRLRHALHNWSRLGTSNSARQIRQVRTQIDRLRHHTPPPWSQIFELEVNLSSACAQESAYWRIKSQNDWLRSGDRNTTFFHRSTIARRHVNRIGPLTTEDGTVAIMDNAKADVAVLFYTSLFSRQVGTPTSAAFTIPHMGPPRVTTLMNENLVRSFSDAKIRNAVFAIGVSKSPGPDGFTAGFYRHFWHIIGYDVCTAIRAFFTHLEYSAVLTIPS